jgi:NTP pyrophosphatase (non-canonical NTP hydrolase)
MTTKEAIVYLRQICPYGGNCLLDKQRSEAIRMAIDVLSNKPTEKEEHFDAHEEALLSLYNRAINSYGIDSQKWMVVEECGELLNALAKLKRGRSTKEEIITELADVHIMVEQMAYFFGWYEFITEKRRKLQRLLKRLSQEGGDA